MKARLITAVSIAILTLVSCTVDNIEEPELTNDLQGVIGTVPGFVDVDDILTKTSVSTAGAFSWSEGDMIGVFANDGETQQTNFTIKALGVDASTASFNGGAWAIREGVQYGAYYPYQNKIVTSSGSVEFSVEGQVQDGNNNPAHLGAFDFMYAMPATATADGTVSFVFQHQVAIFKPNITIPADGTYVSITYSSDRACFARSASIDLEDGGLTTTMSDTMTLGLENVTMQAGEVLIGWLFVIPTDEIYGAPITVSLEDSEGNITKYNYTGGLYDPGKSYKKTLNSPSPDACQMATGPEFNAAVLAAAGGDAENIHKVTFKTGQVVTNTTVGYDITYKSVTNEIVVSTNAENFKLRDDSYNMFDGFNMMTAIEGFEKIDASAANDISEMFMDCSSLESIDLSNFKPNYLGSMYGMFEGCSSLRSLDLSGFNMENTEEIDDYSRMFYLCSSLTSLDLSSFEFSFAMDVSSMFEGCSSLESVSFGDMPQYTNSYMIMNSMFKDCINLKSVDFSGWGIIIPRDIEEMFYDCRKLKTLIFPEIIESELGRTRDMFYNLGIDNYYEAGETYTGRESSPATIIRCSEETWVKCLEWLNESGCSLGMYKYGHEIPFEPALLPSGPDFRLKIAQLVNPDITSSGDVALIEAALEQIEYLSFEECAPTNILGVKINDGYPGIYATYSEGSVVVKTMAPDGFANNRQTFMADANSSKMFDMFINLNTISGFQHVNTSEVTNMSGMFNCCRNLTYVDLRSINTENVTNMSEMFSCCSALTSDNCNLLSFSTGNVTSMRNMFEQCNAMTEIDLSSFDTGKCSNFVGMFRNCEHTSKIVLGDYFTISGNANVSNFFQYLGSQSSDGTVFYCRQDTWDKLTGTSYTYYDSSVHKRAGTTTQLPSASDIHAFLETLKPYSYWSDVKSITFEVRSSYTPADGQSKKRLTGTTGAPVYVTRDYSGTVYFYTSADEYTLAADASGLFMAVSVYGLEHLNTSQVTNMTEMFANTRNTELDLKSWDVSNVTNMYRIFYETSGFEHLESLDISGWNTSKVTNFNSMFNGAKRLHTVKAGKGFVIGNSASYSDIASGIGTSVSAADHNGYHTTFYGLLTDTYFKLGLDETNYNYVNLSDDNLGFDGGDTGGNGRPIVD